MRLYQRYLLSPLKLFLPLFVTALCGLYLLVEFFEKFEDVLSGQALWKYFIFYLILKIPEVLFQVWPAAVSLAILSSLAYLSRGHELLALRSLGFSAIRIMTPYLLSALVLSLGVSTFLAVTLPRASYQALYTWEVKIKGQRPQKLLAQGKLFFTGKDFLLSANPLEPGGELLADFLYIEHRNHVPVRILYAQRARFLGGDRWLLEKAILETKENRFHPQIFPRREFHIPFSPGVVLSVKRPLKALTFKELWRRYRYLKESGLAPDEPLAEMLFRLFYPLWPSLILIPALLAFLAFRGPKATAKGLSAGLLLVVIFYAIFFSAKAAGASGYLPLYLVFPAALVFPPMLGMILQKKFVY